MGVSLIHRLRDGVEPTSAGRVLYRHVQRLTQVLEELNAELSEYSTGDQGHIRLWANTSAVTQFLPEDLKLYIDERPAVHIELREDTSLRIVEAIKDGVADIGIFSDHVGAVDVEHRIYRRDTLMVITSPAHPLAGRSSVRLADTALFDHVGLQTGSSLEERVQRAARKDDIEIRTRVQVFGFDGIRRMVEAGLGVAILPQGAVLPYLDGHNLVAMALDEPWANRALMIGFRDYRSLPIVSRHLIETLAPRPPGEAS